jgi:hypothetical protein
MMRPSNIMLVLDLMAAAIQNIPISPNNFPSPKTPTKTLPLPYTLM